MTTRQKSKKSETATLKSNLHMESEIDVQDRFKSEMLHGNTGCALHLHRNVELYGVKHGQMSVTVRNEKKVLTDGQMAMIGGLECHSFGAEKPMDTFFMQIGGMYTEDFLRLYSGKLPAIWLMDAAYNMEFIYPFLETVWQRGETMTTLERIGIVNLIYAKIIEHYGLRNFTGFNSSKVDIDIIIQYIYDNYKEPITLESLANRFGYNPRVLSGKLSKTTGMDFRIFISDIRMQKVITMCHDKQNADMALIDIVSRCGFNCVASFYRAYKRAYNRNFKFNNLPIH